MAHSFGVRTAGNFKVVVAKNGVPEKQIESEERRGIAASALFYEPIELNGEQIEQITLDVAQRYYNARVMFRNMSDDKKAIKLISENLRGLGFT